MPIRDHAAAPSPGSVAIEHPPEAFLAGALVSVETATQNRDHAALGSAGRSWPDWLSSCAVTSPARPR